MSTQHTTTSLLRACGMMLVFIAATAFATTQPRMHEAADALNSAKRSPNPMEDLVTAKQRLRHGATDKGGYRVEAMRLIDQAIGKLKAGDRLAANKLIDQAITKVGRAVTTGHDRAQRREKKK